MTAPPAPNQDGTPPPGLRRMRRFAAAVLLFERGWPAVAPAVFLIGALACVALLDLPRMLPPTLHVAGLALSGMAVLALLARGLGRVRRPHRDEADRRLEADSNLRHQPLAVLSDTPATGGDALWAAHVARARAQLGRLRLRAPRPMLAAADPRAIRGLVLVGLAASLVIAGPDAPQRLAAAFQPSFLPAVKPPAPLVQAWITPPAYTDVAPIFLKPEGGAVTAPSGSKLSISVTGGSAAGAGEAPTLEQAGHAGIAFPALDPTSFQIEQTLTTGGRLTVRRHGREMAGWDVAVVEDQAPVVTFPEPPGWRRNGPNPETRLPWQVSHPYGVTSLQAELHLAPRPDAPALTMPIPLPGNAPKSAKGALVQDLTANPWAGLPVTVQLTARDAPGLVGHSEIATFILPERRFMNAIARAVIAVRKQLSLTPDDRRPAVAELDRLSGLPEVWDTDTAGFLNLRAIASLLYRGREPGTVAEAQDRMWSLALHLEEGAGERTAKALEAARQELRDALDAQKRGDTKDSAEQRAEIDRRIRALEDALQKRLDALSEQARRDPESDGYNPEDHPLDQRDMQKLADQMRDAARKGNTDAARDRLAELEKMMEALKNSRPDRSQMTERDRKRAEQRQRGQQQMSALQDMIRREGDLLDSAQSRATEAEDASRPYASPPPADPQPDNRQADQRTQLALRRAVGALMQDYGDLTGQVPPNLGDADAAMRDGAQAIAESHDAQAAELAQKAIEALQKGGKSMQQQMAQQFGRGQPQSGDQADDGQDGDGTDGSADGDGQGDGNGQGGRRYGNRPGEFPGLQGPSGGGRQQARRPGMGLDPLGRPRGQGTSGSTEAGDVHVPEQMEQARTRELQDELRRRGADRSRSQEELDYIDRLLKQF